MVQDTWYDVGYRDGLNAYGRVQNEADQHPEYIRGYHVGQRVAAKKV